MNQTDQTLPADIQTTTTDPTIDRVPGEGVKAMTASEKKRRTKRAWDEMSTTDREVLMESVRARRQASVERDTRELMLWLSRVGR